MLFNELQTTGDSATKLFQVCFRVQCYVAVSQLPKHRIPEPAWMCATPAPTESCDGHVSDLW